MNGRGEQELRLLFVEDSVLDFELAMSEVGKLDLVPVAHRIWDEAGLLSALEAFRPDVIICDHTMPGFDGLTALRLVRERAPQLPFIFVSGTIGEEVAIAALQGGATDYVLKSNLIRLAPAITRAVEGAGLLNAKRKVEESHARLAAILQETPDLVIIADPQGTIQFINDGGCRMLGYARAELAGRLEASLYPQWARELLETEALPRALREGTWRGETALLSAGGEEVPVSHILMALKDGEGQVHSWSSIGRDIRDRKAYEQRITHLASHDALTDLPNRLLLRDRAEQAISHARRAGAPLAMLVVNLDGFATVNEAYGRAVGDLVLVEASQRLAANLRPGDTVARLAADSFAVLLAQIARNEDALLVAQKLSAALYLPMKLEAIETTVSASVGISLFPRDGDDSDTLVRHADSAMHQAKLEHQGNIQFYNRQWTTRALLRVELANSLRSALHRGQLAVFYQPLFELSGRRIVGFEALLRWMHPERGAISPALFIPLAEESGLIAELGEWVLEQACSQAAAWLGERHFFERVSVNISPRQLHAGLVGSVQRALTQSGLPARCLELELTEGALMRDAGQTVEVLNQLKALGLSLAVDDFGTGYSSLSYLSRFPLDRLKIDRSFVKRMTTDGNDREIVQAIISLGRALSQGIVAEGVETEEQLRLLEEDGCQEGQGFLVSPAVAPEQIGAMLDRQR